MWLKNVHNSTVSISRQSNIYRNILYLSKENVLKTNIGRHTHNNSWSQSFNITIYATMYLTIRRIVSVRKCFCCKSFLQIDNLFVLNLKTNSNPLKDYLCYLNIYFCILFLFTDRAGFPQKQSVIPLDAFNGGISNPLRNVRICLWCIL